MTQRYDAVLRPFQGERLYEIGEVVETSGWRWREQLVERRYLAPAQAPPPEPEPEPEPVPVGRRGTHREAERV